MLGGGCWFAPREGCIRSASCDFRRSPLNLSGLFHLEEGQTEDGGAGVFPSCQPAAAAAAAREPARGGGSFARRGVGRQGP
eukprot:2779219-Pyramimonas_sp.AAC.1